MTDLLPQHLADLRRSGLTDETIRRAGIRSEVDPLRIGQLLRWRRAADGLGPCLVFPCRHIDGTFDGFLAIKPDCPRIDKDGRLIKYEHPVRVERQPYFGERASQALSTPKDFVLFTEGFKKLLSIEQAGLPCIGLSGVNAWSKPKEGKDDKRVLSQWLAYLSWHYRVVGILFDTDLRRNPDVNREAACLAAVLSEAGAIVEIIHLPSGPRDEHGLPTKMGADDFIVEFGEQAFRDVVVSQLERGNREPASLDTYREALRHSRVASLRCPGLYLDRSPTGSGKTHADLAALKQAESSLTVLPTHSNCREFERTCHSCDVDAVSYPEISAATCWNFVEAKRVLDSGLSVSQAICPHCPDQERCECRRILTEAEDAPHRIATHHRAALSFEHLANGRDYIAIHEDSTDLLRPSREISGGLELVARVAHEAITLALGRQLSAEPDRSEEYFFRRMYDISLQLAGPLASASMTTRLELPFATGTPRDADRQLYHAMQRAGVWPPAEPLQLVKMLAGGEIDELVVRVDQVFTKGGEKQLHRAICGVRQTRLPTTAVIWLADATAHRADVEALAGRPVRDATPPWSLTRKHPVLQIPVDVTKGTAAGTVVDLLRGLLMRLEYRGIGVITHKQHVSAIKGTADSEIGLDADSRKRIARVEHFRSGESRGSNAWLNECDCRIVLGTPRVPPAAIRQRLIQLRRPDAAARSEEWTAWGRDYWSGVTTSGRRITVRSRAYRDHDWHRAHQSIVKAELIQAAGRGRTVVDSGIPVLIVSTEELGYPILDIDIAKPDATDLLAVRAVTRLSLTSPKERSLADMSDKEAGSAL